MEGGVSVNAVVWDGGEIDKPYPRIGHVATSISIDTISRNYVKLRSFVGERTCTERVGVS